MHPHFKYFVRSVFAVCLAFFTIVAGGQQVVPDEPDSVAVSADDAAAFAAARIGGNVSVSIELRDEPTTVVYDRELKKGQGHGNAVAAAKRHWGQVKKNQDEAQKQLEKLGAKIVFKTHKTFNGFGAYVPADKIEEIRNLDSVKAVEPLVPQTPDNSGSVPFIGTATAWMAGIGNNTGDHIKIGVIDTGIDYIHTNMGGAGTGYAANDTKVIGDVPGFPGSKVVGGWDFAGDNYDAGTAGKTTPAPDPDPMDCGGHGSHVSGTVAGYGVRPDGSTFTGPYDGSTPFSSLKIGPGVAPRADLYALRVFGCAGSTLLTTSAIEWAVDPNDDDDFSDHLDVINMSLGSAFGSATDSSATASQNAALAGVIVVVAAGNNGDTHYTVGSPGTSTRAITVAAMQDPGFQGMSILSPASIAGVKPVGKVGAGWAAGATLTDPGVTGTLTLTVPANGCAPITNSIAGKIAFIDRGGTLPDGVTSCGFENKAKNAQNAGAIGVIVGSIASSANPEVPINMAPAAPSLGASIPVVQMGLTDGNVLRTALGGGSTVTATLARSLTASLPLVADVGASFSSRGIRRGDNLLKPDIAAPGVNINSTLALSGNDSFDNNGTSMATPHIAGVMALLRQLHPTWSVEELKALAMNTATNDVYLGNGQTGARWGTARVGAGRVNVGSAASSDVIAMNDLGDGSVSVSFGDVPVPVNGTFAGSKTIKVVNKGAFSVSYNLSVSSAQNFVGAAYSVSPASVTVPAGSFSTIQVTLNANGLALRHAIDATSTTTQTNTGGTALSRTYLTEPTANVVLSPTVGAVATLRVPVHAIVRPTTLMGTTQTSLTLDAATGSKTLSLSGTTFTGTGAIQAVVFPLEHVASSPDLGSAISARRAADIKEVGIYSTTKANGIGATTSNVYFGISTYGKWTTLLDVEFDVYIDRNRDGVDDVVFFNTTQSNGSNRLDVHGTSILTLPAQTTVPGSVFAFTNGTSASLDTVQYNTNTIVLPARAVDMGLTGATPFNWRIQSFARGISGIVDTISGTYDPLKPGIVVGAGNAAPLFLDSPANLTLNYVRDDFNANNSKGVLLFHFHNNDGAHDQVIPVVSPRTTTTTVAPVTGQYSDGVTLTATVAPSSAAGQTISGTVAFTVDGSPAGSAAVNASGVASVTHTITGAAGPHSIGATFTSTSAYFSDSSGAGTLTVTRETASVSPSAGNPALSPAGATFSLSASIAEVADGSAGDIALAAPVTITLTPASGPAISQTASISVSGSTAQATASFAGVPSSVYSVTFAIGGSYYTGSATSSINVYDPAAAVVSVAPRIGQYSDPVTLSASVTPVSYLGQTISGTVQFRVDGNAVGAPVSVDASGNASISYTIAGAAGAHSITANFTPGSTFFSAGSGSATLTALLEDAIITPSASNPSSVPVSSPGGNATSITLSATVAEVADGSLGDITKAIGSVTLTPIGPGSAVTLPLNAAGNATFTNVAPNVYDVTYAISGAYYAGPAASGILAVFDPSQGNVTGGGTIMHNGVRANFGFNIKYQKNGNAQGNFLYIEHRPTGDVKVKSNALDTLSIAGNTAIILGKATVGEVGNNQFRLTVVDNGEPGSSDQLGLKVTKNGSDLADLTFDPVTLSGGNIQVPKP